MRDRERGSVTAELAVALPAVVLVLVVVLTVGSASSAHLRALDAARTGARAAALGDDDAAVVADARHVAGAGAEVSTRRDADWVTVTVTAPVVGGWSGFGPLRASATASALVEP
ncbi:TadE family type IV pilus minor pilin [Luteimicrobium subarcticum]|uniref:TadE-like protein n=1 Tax=Luteimicrobium subarcticum TaxID=620910 RepID=A0A2M8WSF6_9MICO|nr:TadE family type IV pilus minor pilin [Luteimicrobium subarcticum]PJI93875.1 TadE-like protein [Luteimicrobium subarcticum]